MMPMPRLSWMHDSGCSERGSAYVIMDSVSLSQMLVKLNKVVSGLLVFYVGCDIRTEKR